MNISEKRCIFSRKWLVGLHQKLNNFHRNIENLKYINFAPFRTLLKLASRDSHPDHRIIKVVPLIQFINPVFESLTTEHRRPSNSAIQNFETFKFLAIWLEISFKNVQNMKVFKFWIDELEHFPASLDFVTAFFEFLAVQKGWVVKKKYGNWLILKKNGKFRFDVAYRTYLLLILHAYQRMDL